MIGWYVHHRGQGHRRRAGAITTALRALAIEVTVFSSAEQPAGWPAGSIPWQRLPPDAGPEAGGSIVPVDPTAGGTLHWVPLQQEGLRRRMAAIARWIDAHAPAAFVVDASVEVGLLARLHGIPVVCVAAPGDRHDGPHMLAYDQAQLLLAPWPRWATPERWPAHWRAKTVHLGGVSRFDGRPRATPAEPGRVVLLTGTGGTDHSTADVLAAAAATQAWHWHVVGTGAPAASPGAVRWHGWVADPWPLLCSAAVVVAHAGQNAVAEVAAARRPAVLVAQHRPHREQEQTAAVIGAARLAPTVGQWPAPQRWPELLDQAERGGGQGWSRWSDGSGAMTAARAIAAIGAGGAVVGGASDGSLQEWAPRS